MVKSLQEALDIQGKVRATSLHQEFRRDMEYGYENYFEGVGLYAKMNCIQLEGRYALPCFEDFVGKVSIENLTLLESGKLDWIGSMYREHQVEIEDQNLSKICYRTGKIEAISPSKEFAILCE